MTCGSRQHMRSAGTIAQNAAVVYVADPIAQHVLVINLESGETTGDIELDFVPSAVTWLGIAEAH